jgi:hypothetical protein
MKDKDFIILLKKVRRELHRRHGTKMCEELHADCPDCKARILIAGINSQIDFTKD